VDRQPDERSGRTLFRDGLLSVLTIILSNQENANYQPACGDTEHSRIQSFSWAFPQIWGRSALTENLPASY
jgi:hypothetical protein